MYENLRIIMFEDELGKYFSPQLEVYVKLDNGTEIRLINILYNVLVMWRDVLDELDIIKDDPLEPLIVDIPISRDEANMRQSSMQVREGEDYQFDFRMEKFNYENKVIEPMDASGMDIKFQLQKLPETAPIRIQATHQAISVEIDVDIPLSKEQAQKYVEIREDNLKEKFLEGILETLPDIKKDIQSKIRAAINTQISKQSQNPQ
ncbi:MAG: hypothetical protein IH589_12045 [Anaerolineales bacterium]|nr:hypothetical protein [Anaerolineales bacterium]